MMPAFHDPPKNVLAPPQVLGVWRGFDDFPMETLTKAWVYAHSGPRQRTVAEMEAHRQRYGASGNCFDLAIWLKQRLEEASVQACFISEDIKSEHAHVAVLATEVGGKRFLCDLGDMWLQPVAVDEAISQPIRGLFPGADITLETDEDILRVAYHRHGGKISRQSYGLTPVPEGDFCEAAEANQRVLAQRLVEVRDPMNLAHWEYQDGICRTSTHTGQVAETPPRDRSEAALRIAARSRMSAAYVERCLAAFDANTCGATEDSGADDPSLE